VRPSGRVWLLLGVVLALLAFAAPGGYGQASGSARSPRTTVHRFTFDGLERSYRLHLPGSGSGARPLVVVLHGAFGSARQAESAYGWDAVANRKGFLVAYPDGWQRTWNTGGGCCGAAALQRVDDVGFLSAVVRRIRAHHRIDARRIYLAGMSNGAIMTYTMACRSRVFAAIGPVAGTQLVRCPHAAPVSVVHVHGLADTLVPFDAGVPQVIAGWRAIDRCASPSVTVRGPVRRSSSTCPRGRAVTLITIAGAGHAWPGASTPGPLDATRAIWRFFEAHPKPR
jgi:polyhydroxybutyrate depolymerase